MHDINLLEVLNISKAWPFQTVFVAPTEEQQKKSYYWNEVCYLWSHRLRNKSSFILIHRKRHIQ